MGKGSPELLKARKQEIVEACELLYRTKSFKEITLKEIGKVTSFSRPTIYNYFETKEEIFLEILKNEYVQWKQELDAIGKEHEALTKEKFADLFAKSLENRKQMLKILSMNLYDIEDNSRMENLVALKVEYKASIQRVQELIAQFFPSTTEQEREQFIWHFFPYIFGMYPYTEASEKQKEAMERAGIQSRTIMTVYELARQNLLKILPNS